MLHRSPQRVAQAGSPYIGSSGCLLFALLLLGVLAPSAAGEQATVHRDQYGTPHIWSGSYESAGYAVGYCQCEDSLVNVMYCLYAGVGRLSELFGSGLLAADTEARTLRHQTFAEQAWPDLSVPLRGLITGYCAGVNAYLETHRDELPVEVARVEPVQVVAWHRSLMKRSAVAIAKLDAENSKADGYRPVARRRRDGQPGADNKSSKHPGTQPGHSNSWALSGAKTASGAPMLLIDPHWPSEGHLQLYPFWLHVGDDLNVGGFGLTGTPLPGLGVTPYATWTVTAGGADSSDAYALRINPDDPHQYQLDGKWKNMDVRVEKIRVKLPDGRFEEKTREVLETCHGPILKTKGGVPFAAAMGGYDRADSLDQFFKMATARDTVAFKAAIAMNRLSYFNLMWATTEGDIGYVQTGQAPLRPEGFNWEKMVPGWTSDSLYKGELPFGQLPIVENPLTGFLQNCNVAANVVTPGLTFTKNDFAPNVLYGHYAQYRARGARATRLLTEVEQATIEDGRRIAFDAYVPPADLWVPVILQAYAEHRREAENGTQTEADQRLATAVRLLGTWNRYATRHSTGATVFRFWRLACNELTSSVGRDRFVIANTPGVRQDALRALRQAAERIHAKYGKVAVAWGDVKRMRRGDVEWPLSGDGLGKLGMDTLRATPADRFDDQHKLIPRGGQCVTTVVELTDPPRIRSVVMYGQSNKPNSPHFADQAPLYANEQLREVPWTLEQLRPHIESTRVFETDR
ncbi:MAG: hypothetical protein CMJ59_18550 [Planctomycetaceae bacterium]|nr:hypothetical protein [Planctomycetaceae bacterium]